jgi:hypothetical protein
MTKTKSQKARARAARQGIIAQRRGRTMTQRSSKVVTVVNKTVPSRRRQPARRVGKPFNPYLAALMDPENVIGMKCPGPTGVPTGTFQLTYDAFLTTDANGYYCVAFNPMAMSSTGLGIMSQATSSGGTNTFTTNTYITTSVFNYYDAVRCVSACMKSEYVGNTSSDSGLNVGWWDVYTDLPTSGAFVNYLNGTAGVPSVNSAWAKAYNQAYPTRNGMCVLWRPIDYSTFDFYTNSMTEVATWPCIGIQGLGVTASAAIVKVRVIANYEGILKADTNNFGTNTTTPNPPSGAAEEASSWAKWLGDKVVPIFGVVGDTERKIQNLYSTVVNNADNIRSVMGGANAAITGARNVAQLYGAYRAYQQINRRNQQASLEYY